LAAFSAEIPRDHAGAAVVFQMVTGAPVTTQEYLREDYHEFTYDVLFATAGGAQSFPYEEADIIHQTIKTSAALTMARPWRDGEITVDLTCDRVQELAIPVQDVADDYRMAGGRYLIRVGVVD
jgi:hypothetical protein